MIEDIIARLEKLEQFKKYMENLKPKENKLNFGLDLTLLKEDQVRPENYQFGAVEKIVLQCPCKHHKELLLRHLLLF